MRTEKVLSEVEQATCRDEESCVQVVCNDRTPVEEVATTMSSDDHAALAATIDQLLGIANGIEPKSIDGEVGTKLRTLVKALWKIRRPEVVEPMTVNEPALAKLQQRLGFLRDRVRGVVKHGYAGLYLCGRAGTAKTYTVLTTLDEAGCKYVYQSGHITPIGLFELIEENSTKVIVLDDVAPIFNQPAALAILLAALGKQPDGRRVVKYKRQGRDVEVEFKGGIIAISNLELRNNPVEDALRSRMQVRSYDPSDEEIKALMYHISSKGCRLPTGKRLSAEACRRVADHLIHETERLGLRPDVRMLVDKAFLDYGQYRAGGTETHWKDLITSSLEDRLAELKHTEAADPLVLSKKEEKATERQLLEKIMAEHSDPQMRLEAFARATGKSKRTCQRRMRELRAATPQPMAG